MLQTKLIKSGPMVESYTMNVREKRYHVKRDWQEEDNCEEQIDGNLVSFYRSKKVARRIIFCNAWRWYKDNGRPYSPFLLTLTFEENIKDLKTANRMFSKFIQRFNYMLTGKKKAYLQYLGVVEFQKRGAIHYHVIIFNLPYIKHKVYETIRNIWGQGRIELKKVDTIERLIGYLSKYMVKDFSDKKLANKKRYFTSKKIKRPLISYDPYTGFFLPVGRLVFEKEMEFKYVGRIVYRRYILTPEDEIALYFNCPGIDERKETNVLSLIKDNNLKLNI